MAFTVVMPAATIHRILTQSHHHNEAGQTVVSVYGSTYSLAGTSYAVRGDVNPSGTDEIHVEIEYTKRKAPRPPRGWKSVGSLITDLADEPREATIETDAYFAYDERWRSAIEIPTPLAGGPEHPAFTQIEAIRFANRNNPDNQYALQVRRGVSGDVRHWVSLTSKMFISVEVLPKLLEASHLISAFLVRPTEEDFSVGP